VLDNVRFTQKLRLP